jgi:hypothetical protein
VGSSRESPATPPPAQDRSRTAVQLLCRSALDGPAGRGIDGVAVSRCTRGAYAGVVFASNDTAASLEESQDTLGEGPGPTALEQGRPVLVPDLPDRLAAGSWMAFVPQALSLGVASVFAFPARVGAAGVGLLTVHAQQRLDLDVAAERDLRALSDSVALALLIPEALSAPRGDGLTDVLAVGHALVHQAVGMVSVQLGTTLEMAAAALRAHAFATDQSLRDVARAVVDRRLSFSDGGGVPGDVSPGHQERKGRRDDDPR